MKTEHEQRCAWPGCGRGSGHAVHIEECSWPHRNEPCGTVRCHDFVPPADPAPVEEKKGECPVHPCDGSNPVHRFAEPEAYLTALINDTERRVDNCYFLSVDTIYHLRASVRTALAQKDEALREIAELIDTKSDTEGCTYTVANAIRRIATRALSAKE